jgi:hypothetical protein
MRSRFAFLSACIALLPALSCFSCAEPQATQPATESAPAATTQPAADLPKADDLIAAAEKAMGGREAIDAITSVYYKATSKTPKGEATLTYAYAKPDKGFASTQMEAVGLNTQYGTDGVIAWTSDPRAGGFVIVDHPSIMRVVEGGNIFNSLLFSLRENYKTRETVGKETRRDREVWKVRMFGVPAGEAFAYFDVENHLLDGITIVQKSASRTFESQFTLSDWRQVEGTALKVFHKVDLLSANGPQAITMMELKFNSVDPAVFEIPQGVKDLAAKQKATAATQPASPTESAPKEPATAPATAPDQK